MSHPLLKGSCYGFLPAVALAAVSIFPLADARTWTDSRGRPFEAEFVKVNGAEVILTLPNGRSFSMPQSDLSAADRAFLASKGGGTAPNAPAVLTASPATLNFGRPWPRDVRMDGASNCKVISEDAKAGRYVYESPGYRFTCDSRVTDDALRNFSVMFETTRKYAQLLPLSLGGGRERNGKLDILLFGTQNAYISAGGSPGSAGCFVPSKGLVMVPMESLGLVKGSTGYSLDIKKKNDVLVHELCHQLSPNVYFAPGALGWFSEGLAEYMAATPYSWGYFSPDAHGNVVKAYVTTAGTAGSPGRALGTTIQAPDLRSFFLMSYGQFSGPNGNFNYGVGLLLTHYFFHMEGGGKAYRMTQFLQGLHQGKQGEEALKPLLGGGDYEKLEKEISAAWSRLGVQIQFGR